MEKVDSYLIPELDLKMPWKFSLIGRGRDQFVGHKPRAYYTHAYINYNIDHRSEVGAGSLAERSENKVYIDLEMSHA